MLNLNLNHSFVLGALLFAFGLTPLSAAQLPVTERISVSQTGGDSNGASYPGAISADGNLVLFYSEASNLVAGDNNSLHDVFLRDRKAQTTHWISQTAAGLNANGSNRRPAMTPDGRFVCFESNATNLSPGTSNLYYDILLFDRQNGTMELISANLSGQDGDHNSASPSISDDGRFVLFQSFAEDLVPNDNNWTSDVFLRDRALGTTTRISVDPQGLELNKGSYLSPTVAPVYLTGGSRISGDGQSLVFWSDSDQLVANDFNNKFDVFLHDRLAGTTERVSETVSGEGANLGARYPTISRDGTKVFFLSNSTNLGHDITGDQLFSWERATGLFQLGSVGSDGQISQTDVEMAAAAADGLSVAFQSYDPNLIKSHRSYSSLGQIFGHDFPTGVTRILSVNSNGKPHEENSTPFETIRLSETGRYLAFASRDNLVPDDHNGREDVYVHDLANRGAVLELNPLIAGQDTRLTVEGATPGGDLLIAFSQNGQGPIPTQFGLLNVGLPLGMLTFTADASGGVDQFLSLPSGFHGASLWVQGIDLATAYPTTIFHGKVQ
ncbi:MAG: hypothetical protein DWQ01_04490 [Planctomycetota bacterium]|nr:MAG: hypothetical protein DWQ01_04490 [Planctomycetota bacterium]